MVAITAFGIGLALGWTVDPFGDDEGRRMPAQLSLPAPSPTAGATPIRTLVPTATPTPTPRPEPTTIVLVTQVPVPVLTEVPVQVDGLTCELLVSPQGNEVIERLYTAKGSHQDWIDYLLAYPDTDPPDDGMTGDERLAYESDWVQFYDRAIRLLEEMYVACSPLMRP